VMTAWASWPRTERVNVTAFPSGETDGSHPEIFIAAPRKHHRTIFVVWRLTARIYLHRRQGMPTGQSVSDRAEAPALCSTIATLVTPSGGGAGYFHHHHTSSGTVSFCGSTHEMSGPIIPEATAILASTVQSRFIQIRVCTTMHGRDP
jgi:hypothetical protein